ncbi:MAG: hypothetical protein LBM08_05755 [Dysgonamonadaceae bacterium]|jgi:hypothetical protein|nr:hypothetical protein [Dysgonamonadaceae bacterium]
MKQLIIAMIICAFTGAKGWAQAFETSDTSAPKWYLIQVKSSGDNAGKVLTEINGKIIGQLQETGLAAQAKQWWRIAAVPGTTPTKYEIINKYSRKKLDVFYDDALNERMAVTSETPSTSWTIQLLSDNYYYLRINTQPSGGDNGAGYLTQSGASLNSALYFTKSYANADARFQFISMDVPIVSSDDETAWLSIQSAQSDLSDKYLTEIETTGNIQLSMQEYVTNNYRQQWKIVGNPDPESSVNFVNRATGNLISTTPVYDIYNYIQYAATENTGWTIDKLENNQYEVRTGPVETGKYWYAATNGQPSANYVKGASLNTGFAWKFQLREEALPTVMDVVEYDNIRVFVKDRRICVEGADQYRVYTIYGTSVNGNGELPAGVYLVTIKHKTAKILVK